MPDKSPPVLVVLIDAFRHDFLADDVTPNLARLATDGIQLPLRPILGYSDAIRATFFTGKYPDETGYWMEYCYRPEASPWKGMERFARLDQLPFDPAVRGAKMVMSMTAMKMLAKRREVPHLDLRNMPLKAAGKFDFTLSQPMTGPNALGHPSIFDVCTASGRPWAYLDASKARRGSDLVDLVTKLSDDVGLIFVYLHQIDMAAHLFGIASKLFWRRVQSTDALLGQIVARVRLRFGDVDPLIFSDHGMSVLLRQMAIQDLLEHPGFPDRFFVALDATMVRLWFFDDDERLRSEVRDRVASRYPGRFLSEEDLKTYHLQFTGRLYGDEIYLLEPGIGIFPNFHSYIKPKAMHAYEPTDRDQWGIFIGPASTRSAMSNPVELTEVTALVMTMLNPPMADL
jgi:Type I phosphodiesterase / nucleotide pyrophosphatase